MLWQLHWIVIVHNMQVNVISIAFTFMQCCKWQLHWPIGSQHNHHSPHHQRSIIATSMAGWKWQNIHHVQCQHKWALVISWPIEHFSKRQMRSLFSPKMKQWMWLSFWKSLDHHQAWNCFVTGVSWRHMWRVGVLWTHQQDVFYSHFLWLFLQAQKWSCQAKCKQTLSKAWPQRVDECDELTFSTLVHMISVPGK